MENFNLKYLIIEIVTPNLSQFYFCLPEIFKTTDSNQFFSTKSPFEAVFLCCEFIKIIFQ